MARHGLIALVLLAALAAPAQAGAQEERRELLPGSRYGGGWAGQTRQLWLRAAVDETGRFLSFAGRVEASCASGDLSMVGVPVEQAPGFALAGTTREGPVVTRWRLSGDLDNRRGRGRLDATITVRRPGRDRRCSVNARPWVLSSEVDSSATGVTPPGARFHGTLAGGGTLAVLHSSRRDVAVVIALGMDMSFCPRRPGAEFWAIVRRVRLGDESMVARDVVRGAGIVRRVRITISGYVYGGELDVTVAIREVARSARTGRRLWACDTGFLSGEATRFGPPAQAPASSDS